MKKVLGLIMVLLVLSACGRGREEVDTSKLRVGIVLGTGGLGDKSFNDSAYAGLLRARDELGAEFKYVEPANVSEFDQFLDDYASAGYDLVVGVGFDMEDSLRKTAQNYPGVNFVIVDAVVEEENVTSIVFDEVEGSFIVGALAGMMTETDKLGFIGGLDISFINRFRDGFEAGAKHVNPEAEVMSLYVGGVNPFNDPAKAKEQAISLNKSGADIIYAAAGGSGRGVMDAVAEGEKLYAIGVDSNQDGDVEGKVITSMLKRVDNAIYKTIEDSINGEFKGGVTVFGLEEGGVSITDLKFTRELIGEERLQRLEGIQEGIIEGEIQP
ncbi:BMP family ABC transporter substrate-binding protein [Propionigenium maris DSM 9537]|uniref:BMP family ABC transporter substrate-binding protein n=1 Tax=Propionigenium maris DSM 9537 TaxID=1123000 RepID=A0A9W6GMJ9_9FUSO|nr:BMP family ABC transporter substrate-binding protein [Propionigenium maris]GLI56322.1 BMP family ABC transporter substrate-binding protein [Propionigenium maris DSM 9537]